MIPAPGIYDNVPFAEYLTWKLPSKSTLNTAREKSMAHMKAELDAGVGKKPTDAMTLGSALHTTFLEPELATTCVAKWEGPRRAGKEWEAFKTEHEGKSILTAAMHDKLIGMTRSLRKHPIIRQWAGRIERTEVSAVGAVHDVLCRGRTDALTDDPLIDLKKVATADPYIYAKKAHDFGHQIQDALYRRLFDRDRFILATVEDTPPYDVLCYEMSPPFRKIGEEELGSLLQRYADCLASGEWPGRSEEIEILDPPSYLTKLRISS